MLPERQVSLKEFLEGLRELQIVPRLRFAKSQSFRYDNHDRIFLVCTQEPHIGAHLGSTCICCKDNTFINDYDNFKEAMSKEQYDAIKKLLYNYTYSDERYKEP